MYLVMSFTSQQEAPYNEASPNLMHFRGKSLLSSSSLPVSIFGSHELHVCIYGTCMYAVVTHSFAAHKLMQTKGVGIHVGELEIVTLVE